MRLRYIPTQSVTTVRLPGVGPGHRYTVTNAGDEPVKLEPVHFDLAPGESVTFVKTRLFGWRRRLTFWRFLRNLWGNSGGAR